MRNIGKKVNASGEKNESKNDAFNNFPLNQSSSTKELNNDLKSTSISPRYLYENKFNSDWFSNRTTNNKSEENAQVNDNTGKTILKNLMSPPNSSNVKPMEYSSKKQFDYKHLKNGAKFLFP